MADDKVKRVYASTIDGRANNPRYIQNQLKRLYETLKESRTSLTRVLQNDTGYPLAEVEAEYHLTLAAVRHQYSVIDIDKALEEEYSVAHQKDYVQRYVPTGCVYLVPAPPNLLYSAVTALTMAISAGNCVVLELKRTLSELNSLLRQLLTSALDGDTFAVVESRPNDHEFFNKPDVKLLDMDTSKSDFDSPRVVAVVDRTANLQEAASDIVRARFSFGGQSPHAPDVVLVNEFVLKDFCSAVTQTVTSLMSAQVDSLANGHMSGNAPKTPRGNSNQSKKQDYSAESAATLLSTGQGTVLLVRDRSSKLMSTKVTEPLLLIHSVSSLDNAIDLSNSQTEGPLLATYLFTSPPAAKYLDQFIHARLSCTNKIPADLLIGPATPEPYPPSIESRFSLDMFRVQRPAYVNFSEQSTVIATLLNDGDTNSPSWREYRRKTFGPLAPTGQAEGKAVGFFEQGLITGASVLGVTVVSSVALLGYYGLPAILRRIR